MNTIKVTTSEIINNRSKYNLSGFEYAIIKFINVLEKLHLAKQVEITYKDDGKHDVNMEVEVVNSNQK